MLQTKEIETRGWLPLVHRESARKLRTRLVQCQLLRYVQQKHQLSDTDAPQMNLDNNARFISNIHPKSNIFVVKVLSEWLPGGSSHLGNQPHPVKLGREAADPRRIRITGYMSLGMESRGGRRRAFVERLFAGQLQSTYHHFCFSVRGLLWHAAVLFGQIL
jgi:hypothetical protein